MASGSVQTLIDFRLNRIQSGRIKKKDHPAPLFTHETVTPIIRL